MDVKLQEALISAGEATTRLLDGEVGVMPTDTVYGLVARARDPVAAKRLYALKHRENKPGTIIAANVEQLFELGVSESHIRKVERWWPGALSVILVLDELFSYLHLGVGDVATRVVDDQNVRKILEHTGPLLTSSANHPAKPGAVTIEEAWDYFKQDVDFYVDGGDLSGRAPSTIIRLADDDSIDVIRQGAVAL